MTKQNYLRLNIYGIESSIQKEVEYIIGHNLFRSIPFNFITPLALYAWGICLLPRVDKPETQSLFKAASFLLKG